MHTSENLEKTCHKVFQIKAYSENRIINLLNKIDPFCKKSILVGTFFSEKMKNNLIISKRKNLSNSFKSIEKINNQEKFFEVLKDNSINHPNWKKTPPKRFNKWIVKDSRSLGGKLVKKYEKKTKVPMIQKNIYFQKIVQGKIMSAQFNTCGNKVVLLSICLQWLNSTKNFPFLLGGIITQKIDTWTRNKVLKIINNISQALKLNGINSIDFIISKSNKLTVLELNARPGLSINFLSKIYKKNLFSKDIKYAELKYFYASSIIYCKKDFFFNNSIKKKFNKIKYLDHFSELPSENQIIKKYEPICLVHSQSKTEEKAKNIIKKLSKKVLSYTNS